MQDVVIVTYLAFGGGGIFRPIAGERGDRDVTNESGGLVWARMAALHDGCRLTKTVWTPAAASLLL